MFGYGNTRFQGGIPFSVLRLKFLYGFKSEFYHEKFTVSRRDFVPALVYRYRSEAVFTFNFIYTVGLTKGTHIYSNNVTRESTQQQCRAPTRHRASHVIAVTVLRVVTRLSPTFPGTVRGSNPRLRRM